MAQKIQKKEWLLALLGIIIGGTIVAFVGVGMSFLKSDNRAVEQVLDNNPVAYDITNIDAESNPVEEKNADLVVVTEEPQLVVTELMPPVVTNNAPQVVVTQQPVVHIGAWYLADYRKEQFDLDDEDDDVTKIEFDNVCSANRQWTTFCKNVESLRKTTAEALGTKKCDGGGSCTIGNSCLLWNAVTEDDGDVEMRTAIYTCA